MAPATSRIGKLLIVALLPFAAWSQTAKGGSTLRPAGPARIDPNTNRAQVHDRNWLKKQLQKRYNGSLPEAKKTEKPAKSYTTAKL